MVISEAIGQRIGLSGRVRRARRFVAISIVVTLAQVVSGVTPASSSAGDPARPLGPEVAVVSPDDALSMPNTFEPPPGYGPEAIAGEVVAITAAQVDEIDSRVPTGLELTPPTYRVIVPTEEVALVLDLYEAPNQSRLVYTAVSRTSGETSPVLESITSTRVDGSRLGTVHVPSLSDPAGRAMADEDLPPLSFMTAAEEQRLRYSISTTYQPRSTLAAREASCTSQCDTMADAIDLGNIAVCSGLVGAAGAVGLISGWGAVGVGILCGLAFFAGVRVYAAHCNAECSEAVSGPRVWLNPAEMGCTYTYCDPKLHVDFKGRTISAAYTSTRVNWHKPYTSEHPTMSGWYTPQIEHSYGYPWSPQYNHTDGTKYIQAHLGTTYPRWVECTSGIDFKVYFPYTDGSYSQLYIYAVALGAPQPLVKPRFPYCTETG